MKRNALLLFLALLLAAPVARGYDFRKTVKGNTLYFSILPGDSTVAVTAPFGKDGGWGDRARPSGRLTIPAQVQQDGQRYAVVAVESGAFLECDALVAVTIPVSVSLLGGNSFGHCTSLRTVVLECDSLGKVYGAFSGCDAVDTIVLAGDDDGEVEEKPWIFIDGKILRIARATTMRGVGVRIFDEKGHLVVDEQIPHDQPVDNYYIKLPKKQRYFLRFDMGAPHVVDVERQEVR